MTRVLSNVVPHPNTASSQSTRISGVTASVRFRYIAFLWDSILPPRSGSSYQGLRSTEVQPRGGRRPGPQGACPRTERGVVTRAAPERSVLPNPPQRGRKTDKAIDRDLQSPELGAEHGPATCRLWDFTQIMGLPWFGHGTELRGSVSSQGGREDLRCRRAQRCWHTPHLPPLTWPLWPHQTFPPISKVPQELTISGQAARVPSTKRSTTQSTAVTTPEGTSPQKGSEAWRYHSSSLQPRA